MKEPGNYILHGVVFLFVNICAQALSQFDLAPLKGVKSIFYILFLLSENESFGLYKVYSYLSIPSKGISGGITFLSRIFSEILLKDAVNAGEDCLPLLA